MFVSRHPAAANAAAMGNIWRLLRGREPFLDAHSWTGKGDSLMHPHVVT